MREERGGGAITCSISSKEEALQLEGGGREEGRGPSEETEPVEKEREKRGAWEGEREEEREEEREAERTYLASHNSLLPFSMSLPTASSISTTALCIYPPSSPPSSPHRRWRQESMTCA